MCDVSFICMYLSNISLGNFMSSCVFVHVWVCPREIHRANCNYSPFTVSVCYQSGKFAWKWQLFGGFWVYRLETVLWWWVLCVWWGHCLFSILITVLPWGLYSERGHQVNCHTPQTKHRLQSSTIHSEAWENQIKTTRQCSVEHTVSFTTTTLKSHSLSSVNDFMWFLATHTRPWKHNLVC